MAVSGQTDRSKILRWIEAHLDYPHDDYCLIWPFGKRAGYGFLTLDGKAISAHRYICELVQGPAPSEEHVAAHSCDRGHDACVNPRHLSWKTWSENQLDRQDGKGRKRSKLTPEQAAEIRSVATLEPIRVTADRYGVSESAIRQVQSGKTWNGADRRRKFDLTSEHVIYIREEAKTRTRKSIADEMGISYGHVCKIVNGAVYSYVTDERM